MRLCDYDTDTTLHYHYHITHDTISLSPRPIFLALGSRSRDACSGYGLCVKSPYFDPSLHHTSHKLKSSIRLCHVYPEFPYLCELYLSSFLQTLSHPARLGSSNASLYIIYIIDPSCLRAVSLVLQDKGRICSYHLPSPEPFLSRLALNTDGWQVDTRPVLNHTQSDSITAISVLCVFVSPRVISNTSRTLAITHPIPFGRLPDPDLLDHPSHPDAQLDVRTLKVLPSNT